MLQQGARPTGSVTHRRSIPVRSLAGRRAQGSNCAAAAATAARVSLAPQCATRAIGLPVAGFNTCPKTEQGWEFAGGHYSQGTHGIQSAWEQAAR